MPSAMLRFALFRVMDLAACPTVIVTLLLRIFGVLTELALIIDEPIALAVTRPD
jgi:hypothetical protein